MSDTADARAEVAEGEGDYTGSRDGAPGYSPGPTSSTYSGPSARELEHAREVAAHDRPLERDPLGDGIIGGLAGGLTSLGMHGAVSASHVVTDAVVDTAISTAESEFPHTSTAPQTDAGTPHPGENEQPDATVPDATVQTTGAPQPATEGGGTTEASSSVPTDPRFATE